MINVEVNKEFEEIQRFLLKGQLLCELSEDDQLSLPEVDEFVKANIKANLGLMIKKLLLVSFSFSKNVMECNVTQPEQTEKRLMEMMTKMMTGVQDTLLSKVEEKLIVFRSEVTATSRSYAEEPQAEEPEPKKKYQLLVENSDAAPITKNAWSVAEDKMKSKMGNCKVDKVSLTQKGRVTLKVPDEASVAQTTEVLKDAGYKVTDISKINKPTLLPKICIVDIPVDMFQGDELKDQAKNREKKKKDIVKALIAKNDTFRSFMQEKEREQANEDNEGEQEVEEVADLIDAREIDYETLGFKVIYMDKNGGSIIVVVSPQVREFLKSIGDKLYLGYTSCKVFNHFRLTQCYKCQSFGHKSATCSENKEVCMFCAKSGHRSRDCTSRQERSKHCCANCKSSDDTNTRKNANTHNASSDLCPIVIHETMVLMSKTIGGGESKNHYMKQLKQKQERKQGKHRQSY